MGNDRNPPAHAKGRRLARAGLVLAVLASVAPARAFEASVKTLEPRPGVTESFLLVHPGGPPAASVILFSGGEGVVSLSKYGPSWNHGNFLVRTRWTWPR